MFEHHLRTKDAVGIQPVHDALACLLSDDGRQMVRGDAQLLRIRFHIARQRVAQPQKIQKPLHNLFAMRLCGSARFGRVGSQPHQIIHQSNLQVLNRMLVIAAAHHLPNQFQITLYPAVILDFKMKKRTFVETDRQMLE